MRPTILGVKRDYDCFDLTFREHASERWTVKYDPDDLSEILAVNDNGTRRYMLTESMCSLWHLQTVNRAIMSNWRVCRTSTSNWSSRPLSAWR